MPSVGIPQLMQARNPFDGLEADTGVGPLELNILDWGADRTGVASSTAAIRAVVAATTNLRAKVRCPHGRYLVEPDALGYGFQVPAAFTPNGSLGTIIFVGDGASSLLVGPSTSYNIGTTFVMTSTANKPIVRILGGRSVQFQDINFQGTDKTVASSVGVSVYNYNNDVQFIRCGFNGFQSLINIGDPLLADGGSSNNDMTTFIQCKYSNADVAISNYGINNYNTADYVGFFSSNVATAFKYYPHPDGSFRANNEMKFFGSQFLVSDSVVWSSGSAKVRLGITGLYGCVIEAQGSNTIKILRQDDQTATNAHGFQVKDCTIVMNSNTTAQLTTKIIEYYGRGPFEFIGNYVDATHFEIYLGVFGNAVNQCGGGIQNNRFTGRYILRYPIGNPYPAIIESGNTWFQLPKRNSTDAAIAVSDQGSGILHSGVGVYSTVPADTAVTVRAGSIYLTAGATQRVSVAGSYGSLVAVTGSITNGTNTLTLVGGTAGERAKICNGSLITIAGVAGVFEVDTINDETVTLRTNAGATVAGAAVQFSAPTIV